MQKQKPIVSNKNGHDVGLYRGRLPNCGVSCEKKKESRMPFLGLATSSKIMPSNAMSRWGAEKLEITTLQSITRIGFQLQTEELGSQTLRLELNSFDKKCSDLLTPNHACCVAMMLIGKINFMLEEMRRAQKKCGAILTEVKSCLHDSVGPDKMKIAVDFG